MAVEKLPIDPCVFKSANLVTVSEVWTYENNEKKDRTGELKYDVSLPFGGYTKVGVKIKGSHPLLPLDEKIPPETKVIFEGLFVTPYVLKGNLNYSGTATGIRFDKSSDAAAK